LEGVFVTRLSPLASTHHQHRQVWGEFNPRAWLEDYRLACRADSADNDNFIIQYQPIYLTDLARALLGYLSGNYIRSWTESRKIFIDNF
jgi:hypothetical protein